MRGLNVTYGLVANRGRAMVTHHCAALKMAETLVMRD
jgi:hypothetical protein